MNEAITAIVGASARRRGACPTLTAPMRTGDGLLARIRVAQRRLTPRQLREIAALALNHGNGLLEVSARGNLQVRGLSDASARHFAEAVSGLVALESGLVIALSPLAGADPTERADPRLFAQALVEGTRTIAAQLGPKVSVVVDGGGQISLAALKADIRLVAEDRDCWSVSMGGGSPQTMTASGAVAASLALLSALAALGPAARATDLFPTREEGRRDEAEALIGPYALRDGAGYGIALPFAAMQGDTVIALADAAILHETPCISLAPRHGLLLDAANKALVIEAAALGFITQPDDPRLRVSACIGNRGCASGLIDARAIGAALAEKMPMGQHLHVSGCSKGCAHPQRADMTMVGVPQGIGLVIGGRASDTPDRIVNESGIAFSLEALLAREDQ